MLAVTSMLPSLPDVLLPRTVKGQSVDTATGCHFVLPCFPQLKLRICHEVCFSAIKINTMVIRGYGVHTELCYNSGFGWMSRFTRAGFVFFKVDLLRQLIMFFLPELLISEEV